LALGDCACFVVETDGVIVSYGIALIQQGIPTRWNLNGRSGRVGYMKTHPDHRRQGHATTILRAIMSWFRDQGVSSATLIATTDGEPLYRREGFTDEQYGLYMTWVDSPDTSN
jgi:GNAT superfamily N-acetyltransferase